MKKIYKFLTLALLTLITINGCGGGSSTSGSNSGELPTVEVKYTLNGTKRPTCHNAYNKGELNPSPNETIFCRWLCGSYQGSETLSVGLSFEKNTPTEDGIWELYDVSLTEANAQVCKDI